MPESVRYWLLIGEVPSGPFTVAQIHDKIAGGDATWQSLACPVGGSNWLPLLTTPGIGPGAVTAAGPNVGPSGSSGAPREPQNNAANADGRFWVLVDGNATGPFRAGEIRVRLRDGQLTPDAKVRRVGTEVWVSVGDVIRPVPPRTVPAAPVPAEGTPLTGRSNTRSDPAPATPPSATPPSPAHTPFTPLATAAPEAGAKPPQPPPAAPEPPPLLDRPTRQAIQMGIGLLLVVGLLAAVKGSKEAANNRPTLQERLKEQRNNNPLPPVPPPKTKSPSEQ